MRASPASCTNATLQGCWIGARCARWRAIGAARAGSTVRSALPGRFATDVAANHAVPGRTKSSAGGAALSSGDVGNRAVGERQAGVRGSTREIKRCASLCGQLCLVE